MSPRVTPFLAVLVVAVAACAGTSAPAAPHQSAVAPIVTPTVAPAATPAVAPSAPTAPARPAATASADAGNVNAPGTSDLSIEPAGAAGIRVTLGNADAKAWRVSVAGTGNRAADAWTLDVETGDVGPVITTTETAAGVAGEPIEQPGLEMGDASGRICSATLPVCVVAKSVVLPAGGNGTLVLELVRTDGSVPLAVSAATARWTSDPFVLGPWTTTEAFPWEV
jgi:hypothetical protein